MLSWITILSYYLNVDITDFMSSPKKTLVLLEEAFHSSVSKKSFLSFSSLNCCILSPWHVILGGYFSQIDRCKHLFWLRVTSQHPYFIKNATNKYFKPIYDFFRLQSTFVRRAFQFAERNIGPPILNQVKKKPLGCLILLYLTYFCLKRIKWHFYATI